MASQEDIVEMLSHRNFQPDLWTFDLDTFTFLINLIYTVDLWILICQGLLSFEKRNRLTPAYTKLSTFPMTALFDFQSLLVVIVLAICTSTHIYKIFPNFFERRRDGVFGIAYKLGRVGQRLSPWIALCCLLMAAFNFLG